MAQLFLYAPSIDLQKLHRERAAYLIRNARQDGEWADVERNTLDIAGRAIATMIHSSDTNDLIRVDFVTQRAGVDYNLADIGWDFNARPKDEFDTAYMNALYAYAYQQATKGYPWRKDPPFLPAPGSQ